MSFKTACHIIGEKTVGYNALRFETEEEASAYGRDLFSRWMMLESFEVESSDDPVNYARVDGKLARIGD